MRALVIGFTFAIVLGACTSRPAPPASPLAVVATPTPPAWRHRRPRPPPPADREADTRPHASSNGQADAQADPAAAAGCVAKDLAALVTRWEGAAGHRIAMVTLTNDSSGDCTVQGTPEVELLGAHGRILIDSRTDGPDGLPHVSPGDPTLLLHPGGSLTRWSTPSTTAARPPRSRRRWPSCSPTAPVASSRHPGRGAPFRPATARAGLRLDRDERLGPVAKGGVMR